MHGMIIDMNNTDVFISFDDGTTMDISRSQLDKDIHIGDKVDINFNTNNISNDKLVDFF